MTIRLLVAPVLAFLLVSIACTQAAKAEVREELNVSVVPKSLNIVIG